MNLKPKFLATGIGSMPFIEVEHAVQVSLSRFKEAPFWPQLPKLALEEQMEIQYSEGMPRINIDGEKHRMFFDTTGDYSEDFAEFYEAYILAMDPDDGDGDCSALEISPVFSKGFYEMEKQLKARGQKLPFVKVQTTGPCSFALTIVDEQKRAIYYNEEFRDVVIKALVMKCRWQIQRMRPFAEQVICFVDEPILSAFGSSTYVSVKREDIVAALQEMIEAIHADHGIAGIHCCGNTEWSILVDAGVDMINFDAFEYGETIAIYSDHVKTFLNRGGWLAWGIVPTSDQINKYSLDDLAQLFESRMDNLASKGISKQQIVEQAVITPACGTGSLHPADAEKVFETTRLLSEKMRGKYGFNL